MIKTISLSLFLLPIKKQRMTRIETICYNKRVLNVMTLNQMGLTQMVIQLKSYNVNNKRYSRPS